MRHRFEYTVLHHLWRNPLEILTVLYCVPLLWTGLLPFDYEPRLPAGFSVGTWISIPSTASTAPDIASNIALYTPFGVLLRMSLLRRGRGAASSLIGAVAAAAGISLSVESLQVLSPTRISSVVDWASNVSGALLGALAVSTASLTAALFDDLRHKAIRRWRETLAVRPVALIAQLCAATLFLASVAPLDITFSANHIYESVKDIHLIPFSNHGRLSGTIASVPLDDGRFRALIERDLWQLRLDYLWTICGYTLLAVLVVRYLTNHCRVTGARRGIWTVAACAMLAVFSNFARIFIISRSADATEILLAILGSACGVLLADRGIRMWAPDSDGTAHSVRRNRRRMCATALGGWCALIAARQLAPFTPDLSADSIARQVRSTEWLPMQTYQRARLPVAVDDVLNKMARYCWLGVLVCACRAHAAGNASRPRVLNVGIATGTAIAALECLQIILPSRVPALTDVLIATLGSCAGVAAFRITEVHIVGERLARAAATDRVMFNVELGAAPPDRIQPPLEQTSTAAPRPEERTP